MNVGRIFALAVIRKLAYIVVALVIAGVVSFMGTAKAQAQTTPQQAYTNCTTGGYNYAATFPGNNPHCEYGDARRPETHEGGFFSCFIYETGTTSCGTYGWNTSCPAGTTWKESTKQCFDPEACLARNSEPGFAGVGATVRPFESKCVGGCDFRPEVGSGSVCTTLGGEKTCSGTFRFTGDACEVPSNQPIHVEPEQKPKQECIPAVDGQTFCQKPDGKQCFSVSPSKQICWKPGETGTKTAEDKHQQRDSGPTAQPVKNPPPDPETLKPPSTSITTTTTKTVNNVITTITTTTTTRATTNGTDAGAGNNGEPGDGSGAGGGEDADGEKGGESAGGDTCSAPPESTGGDGLLRMIAHQAWKIRCPHGENPLPSTTDAAGEGSDDSETDQLFGDGGVAAALAAGGDASGFGLSRACPIVSMPALTIRGKAIDMPWVTMCDWLSYLSAMILLAGQVAFALIVAKLGSS